MRYNEGKPDNSPTAKISSKVNSEALINFEGHDRNLTSTMNKVLDANKNYADINIFGTL